MADAPDSTENLRVQLWIDLPTIEVTLDELGLEGRDPSTITEQEVVQIVQDDLYEFFFLTEGEVHVNLIRPKPWPNGRKEDNAKAD